MEMYLEEFYRRLRRWEGSLIRVRYAKKLNRNAKEYLYKLANKGVIEKVRWGWYYITPRKLPVNLMDFLSQDINFKAIVGQTAASFWNNDFIHRENVNVVVDNLPYKKALEAFAKKREWVINIEYQKNAKKMGFLKIRKIFIERPDKAIIKCMKKWAFTDAIAILRVNKDKIDLKKLIKNAYWYRVSGTDIRIRQIIDYTVYQLNKKTKIKYKVRKVRINNNFIKKELDEAIEKVLEFE